MCFWTVLTEVFYWNFEMFSNVVNLMCFDLLVNYEWLLNFSLVQQPKLNLGCLIFEVCRSHTHGRTPERMINQLQRPLPKKHTTLT